MSEPKSSSQYQAGPGLNTTPEDGEVSVSMPVGVGEAQTVVSTVAISPVKRPYQRPSISGPLPLVEPCDRPNDVPLSPDLIWLLDRFYAKPVDVMTFTGPATVLLLDAQMQPVKAELPEGVYAIVPIADYAPPQATLWISRRVKKVGKV